jgi:hypothetical protein
MNLTGRARLGQAFGPYRSQPDAATVRARELIRTGGGDRIIFGSVARTDRGAGRVNA